jgi:hypothetical protein
MNPGDLDKVVMLLSTDWFLPYWFILGIDTREQTNSCVQKGCRQIVEQIISGAREYWLTNFSKERVEMTYALFQSTLEKCAVHQSSVQRIQTLIHGEQVAGASENEAWLLVSITRQVLEGPPQDWPSLPHVLKADVCKIFEISECADSLWVDFEKSSIESHSQWDKYIKGLTPDLPTSLSDHLATIRSKDTFQVLWSGIKATLTEAQKNELLNWYALVAERLTGEPLTLPR